MNYNEFKEKLLNYIDEEHIKLDAETADIVSFRCGGRAAMLIEPANLSELFSAVEECRAASIPFILLGNGSNTLFTDKGYDGVVIRIGSGIDRYRIEGQTVFAEPGISLALLAKAAAKEGLSGLEFASGIPGSVGGAVYMNAGAYGGEMKDVVHSVSSLNRYGMMKDRSCEACDFSYRHSIFTDSDEVITGVKLVLKKADPIDIEITMRELAAKRKEKQPLSLPSAGSFFKRPEGGYASQLIDEAGLKGLEVGGAQVSPMHAGFIVNNGNATASDIIALMNIVQQTVYAKSGIMLQPEVRIIGEQN